MSSATAPKIYSMDAFINTFRTKIPSFTEDHSISWDNKIIEARAKYNDILIGLRVFAQYTIFPDLYYVKNIFAKEIQIRRKKGTIRLNFYYFYKLLKYLSIKS